MRLVSVSNAKATLSLQSTNQMSRVVELSEDTMILLPETAKTLPLGQPLLFYLLEINTPEFSATQLDTIDSLIYFSKTDEETEVFVSALFPGQRTMIRSNAETQTYLNEKIYPVLTKGLTFLCKEKPADPVQWLAQWLIRNNPDSAQVQVQL